MRVVVISGLCLLLLGCSDEDMNTFSQSGKRLRGRYAAAQLRQQYALWRRIHSHQPVAARQLRGAV